MSWGLLSVVIALGVPQQANGGGGEVVNDGGDRPGGERLRHWQGGGEEGSPLARQAVRHRRLHIPVDTQAIGTAPPPHGAA